MRRSFVIVLLLSIAFPTLLRAAAEVSFADLAAARKAIVDDPAYFDHLQPMEMQAKTDKPLDSGTLAEQRAECRRRYQAAVKEFAADEQDALRAAADEVDKAVRKDYPRYADVPWNFLKIASNFEAGFPHTRGKHIILPEHVCRWIVAGAKAARGRPLNNMELLLHEQMHVFQRANCELFDSLYAGQWGFIRAKSIKTCAWVEEHQLLNPDAVECPWVFPIRRGGETRYIWPLCSLSDGPGPKRMRSDFKMLAFQVVPDGDGYRVEQSPPAAGPAEVFRAVERAGVRPRLRAVDEHLSSARSVGRPVRQAGALRHVSLQVAERLAAGRRGEDVRAAQGVVQEESGEGEVVSTEHKVPSTQYPLLGVPRHPR